MADDLRPRVLLRVSAVLRALRVVLVEAARGAAGASARGGAAAGGERSGARRRRRRLRERSGLGGRIGAGGLAAVAVAEAVAFASAIRKHHVVVEWDLGLVHRRRPRAALVPVRVRHPRVCRTHAQLVHRR